MEPSYLPSSVMCLAEAENFLGLYELLRKKRVISCLATQTGTVSLLVSNGRIIKHTVMGSTRVLTVQNPWSSLLPSEIECGQVLEQFPCVFYLANGNITCFTSSAGNIFTAIPKYITTGSIQIKSSIKNLFYSKSSHLLLGISETHIQLMGLGPDNDIYPYEPIHINPPGCENFAFFSKKSPNLFYYIQIATEASSDLVNFGGENAHQFVLKKCTVNNRIIQDHKLTNIGLQAPIVSIDMNQFDHLAFLTNDRKVHVLRGTKGITKSFLNVSQPCLVRWHSLGQIMLVLDDSMNVFAFDWNLNELHLINPGGTSYIGLGQNTFFGKVQSLFQTNGSFVAVGDKNAGIISFPILNYGGNIVDLHLRSKNLDWAMQALEVVQYDKQFSEGFFKC